MYNYEEQKGVLFTDEGQRSFIKVRDRVQTLLKQAGAVRMLEAMLAASGDSWHGLACVDRLVELEEIREITQQNVVAAQYRVFVKR